MAKRTVPHFLTKWVFAEIINSSIGDNGLKLSHLHKAHLDDVIKALTKGSVHFADRFVYRKGEGEASSKGGDWGYASSSVGSNLPIGDRGVVLLMGVICNTIYQPVAGMRMIDHMAVPYTIMKREEGSDVDLVVESFPAFANKVEEIQKLVGGLNEIAQFFNDTTIPFTPKKVQRMIEVKEFFSKLDYVQGSEQEHLGSTIMIALKSIVDDYSAAWLNETLETKYREKKVINLMESVGDSEKIVEQFKLWFESQCTITNLSNLSDILSFDTAKDLKMEHGRLLVSPTVYNKIYDRAINGSSADVGMKLNVFNNLDSFMKRIQFFLLDALSLKGLDESVVVPQELWYLLKKTGTHSVSGKAKDVKDRCDYFLSYYEPIVTKICEFINEFMIVGPDKLLPTTRAYVGVKNGIKTIYRIDFLDPYVDNYEFTKFRFTVGGVDGKGSEIVASQKLGGVVENAPNGLVFDSDRIYDTYKIDGSSTNPIGTDELSADFKKFIVDYFTTVDVNPVGTEGAEVSVSFDRTVYTVKPPRDVEREIDIMSSSDEVRLAEGKLYTLERLDVNKDVNLLDLYFADFAYQLLPLSQKQLKDWYESRRNNLSSTFVIGPRMKYLDFTVASSDLPNKAVLLNAGTSGLGDVYYNHIKYQILPTNCNSPTDGKMKSRSLVYGLNRFVTVKIPIFKQAFKKMFFEKVKEGGSLSWEEILGSVELDRKKNLTRYTVKREAYSELMPDYYPLEVTLDLKEDVAFASTRKVAFVNSKTRDKIRIVYSPTLFSLNMLDDSLGDRYYLACPTQFGELGRRYVSDFFELGYTRNGMHPVERVMTLLKDICYSNCFDDSLTKMNAATMSKLCKALSEKITTNFGLSGTLAEFGVASSKTWTDVVEILDNMKKVSYINAKEFIPSLYNTLTGWDYKTNAARGMQLPHPFDYNVELMVNDIFTTRVRNEDECRFIERINVPGIDLYLDGDSIDSVKLLVNSFMETTVRGSIGL